MSLSKSLGEVMKLLLPLFALLLFFFPQTKTTDQPDLVVLKFNCGKFERGSGMIRSVEAPDAAMNEPVRIAPVTRNEPQEVKNRADMQERRAELRATEIDAARSSQPASKLYFYRIQVRNVGAKVVRGFAWQYQPAEESRPEDRQFYCVLNAKANEKKEYQLYSPLAPSRIVDASKMGSKSQADNKGQVIINKIEYVDGSSWTRPGWNPNTFADDDIKKVAGGKCIGI
jgi:hypothetical protein